MDSKSKSSSSSQTTSSVTFPNNKDEENRPLWKYVTKLEKTGDEEVIGSGYVIFVVRKSKGLTLE